MTDTIFRVHPAINFARVGNSDEYYIAPEPVAGELVNKHTCSYRRFYMQLGTVDTHTKADDLRGTNAEVKEQPAKFIIMLYYVIQQDDEDG